MRKIYTDSYVFNPESRTLQFYGSKITSIRQILVIVNQKLGIIIYNFADEAKKGVFDVDTLTLHHDTTAMGGGDPLQIFYEPEAEDAVSAVYDSAINQQISILQEAVNVLQELVSRLSSISGAIGTNADIRVTPIGGTVTTVGTVTTANNLVTIGGRDAGMALENANAISANINNCLI